MNPIGESNAQGMWAALVSVYNMDLFMCWSLLTKTTSQGSVDTRSCPTMISKHVHVCIDWQIKRGFPSELSDMLGDTNFIG